MDDAEAKPCLLMAVRAVAYQVLEPVFTKDLALLHAETLPHAEGVLERRTDIDGVFSTVGFDDSRMFDLLRLVKSKYPHLPFIACRAMDTELNRISLEGVRIAAEALGAVAFIDLPALAAQYGEAGVNAEACRMVRNYLREAGGIAGTKP
jgi:hypothetical protein